MKIVLFCVLLFLASCGDSKEKNNNFVVIRGLQQGLYEIEFSGYRRTMSHDLISIFFDSTVLVHHYIYIKGNIGTYKAGNIKLTYGKGEFVSRYPIQNLKGTFSINDDEVTVDLQAPNYNDLSIIIGYEPYDFNGKFEIRKDVEHP